MLGRGVDESEMVKTEIGCEDEEKNPSRVVKGPLPVPGAVMAGEEMAGLVSSMAIVPPRAPDGVPDGDTSVAETLKVMTVSARLGPVVAASPDTASARMVERILMVVTPLNDRPDAAYVRHRAATQLNL
jgi:hypothetical protein